MKNIFLISFILFVLSSCSWFRPEPEQTRTLRPTDSEDIAHIMDQYIDDQQETDDSPQVGGGREDSSQTSDDLTPEQMEMVRELLAHRCLDPKDDAALEVDQDKDVYGQVCFSNLYLTIKTKQEGRPISTSRAVIPNNLFGIRLEEDLDFINRMYQLDYTILDGQGVDKDAAWLTALLPKGKKFLGSLDTEYRIHFEIMGNYLVLLKGSKNLNAIPYIERTSCVHKNEKGDCVPDGKGFYKVPFLGYPISYCYVAYQQDREGAYERKKAIRCSDTQKDATEKRVDYFDKAFQADVESPPEGKTAEQYLAELSASPSAPYIKLKQTQAEEYEFLHEQNADVKKDLLPSNYFDGEWFFSSGPVEQPGSDGKLAPTKAFLVKLNKTTDQLTLEDISGDRDEKNRDILSVQIPVNWVDYRLNQNGGVFESFAETLDETANIITARHHLQIDFSRVKGEIIDFLITEDYFSFITKVEIDVVFQGERTQKKLKYKVSLLRRDWLDDTGFIESRYFNEDRDSLFGTLFTRPQDAPEEAEHTETQALESWRNIKFSTSQNKEIVWHFSKNSCTGPKGERYRDIAKRAIEVYNRGFELITPEGEQSIRVSLSDEEKDLGDLRYNIINLVCSEDRLGTSGLLGMAPSYVNFDTGQIVGTTANILWHNIESIYEQMLRDYIRYEIFQKDRPHQDRAKYNEYHVTTPYMRARILTLCPEVRQFIDQKKQVENLRPDEDLGDRAHVLSCRDQLIGEDGLALVLHEMGHSFGLGHNFKCSTDKNNYYQSAAEMRGYFPEVSLFNEELPKTACVMDYLPVAEVAPLTVLGKYDLAALRYLYWDEVETLAEGFVSLNTPQEASQQTSVLSRWPNRQGLKTYEHCSDNRKNRRYDNLINNQFSDDLLCMQWDFGSSPEEIVRYHTSTFYRSFNSRYRYDEIMWSSAIRPFQEISVFYWNWMNLLTQNLKGGQFPAYEISDTEGSIDRYQVWLDSLNDSNVDLYRAVRRPIFDFVKDLLFLEGMKCEVENKDTSQRHFVNLEYVQKNLNISDSLDIFVRDCYSPPIRRFLENIDGGKFQLVGQKGVEYFTDYQLSDFLPMNEKTQREVKPDILSFPSFFDVVWSIFIKPFKKPQVKNIECQQKQAQGVLDLSCSRLSDGFRNVLTGEPDLLDEFRGHLEQRILENSSGLAIQYVYDMSITNRLYNFLSHGVHGGARGDARILTRNKYYFNGNGYKTGSGEGSFKDEVKKLALEDRSIEDTKIPFLIEAYDTYLSETQGDDPYSTERVDGFESWLISSNQTIDETDPMSGSGLFFIPFMSDSLVARMILAYNENRAAIEELESRDDLSFIEEMRKQNLINIDRMMFRQILQLP